MSYVDIRNKEFNQNSFNNFIDDLFKENEIGVSKNNFCESYESICVVLFLVIFNQKINHNNQNEFAKKFNFLLNSIKSKELEKIINSNSIDIENIGNFFDIFHQYYLALKNNTSVSLRKSLSAYYTPRQISDLIVKNAFRLKKNKNKKFHSYRYLDPCCGTGVFVSSILNHANKKSVDAKKVLRNITAYDLDSNALKISMILSQAQAGFKFKEIQILHNFQIKDFIFEDYELIMAKDEDFNLKYDFIVMNPPYGIINRSNIFNKNESEKRLRFIKKSNEYSPYIHRNIDLYRLFLIKASKILSEDGVLGAVIPMTFLSDISSSATRKIFFNERECKISEIFYFPEKLKLFPGVTQGFSVFTSNNDHNSIINISEMSSFNKIAFTTKAKFTALKKIAGKDYKIPLIKNGAYEEVIKLFKFPRIKDLNEIINKRGELDLTIHKKYLNGADKKLIRGSSISKFGSVKLFNLKYDAFIECLGNSDKRIHITKQRIVGQNISNSSADERLKFTLIDKNYIVSNSANYLLIDAYKKFPFDNYFLLGILNSSILNKYFKIYSSNNHVNNYEIGEFPIPLNAPLQIINKISKLVKKTLESNEEQKKELQTKIDLLVRKAYKLNDG